MIFQKYFDFISEAMPQTPPPSPRVSPLLGMIALNLFIGSYNFDFSLIERQKNQPI